MMDWHIVEWAAWTQFLVTFALPEAHRNSVEPGALLCKAAALDAPVLCHVNVTSPPRVFPDFDLWIAGQEKRGVPVVNGYCSTIDKRAVQAACAAAGLPSVKAMAEGEPAELLVIKTAANHLGKHERRIPRTVLNAPDCHWPYPQRIHLTSRRDVESDDWHNPALTIERYVFNAAGTFHRAYVVGTYVGVATSRSHELVKEMSHKNGVKFRSMKDASRISEDCRDPAFVAFRLAKEMRADFAAIDLAVDDNGAVHGIDVNTTPWWGDDSDPRTISELTIAFGLLATSGSLYAPRTT